MVQRIFNLVLILCVTACGGNLHNNTGEVARIVRIDNVEKQRLELNTLFHVKQLELHSDTSEYIGLVQDVAVIDSFVYVLDGMLHTLTRFNVNTGLQEKSICKRGNGPLEYIQPMALSADSSHLYVLDFAGRAIFQYDNALEAEKKIQLPVTAFDFVKTEDGFLCYHLIPSDTLGQVVYLNESGKILKSFIPSGKNVQMHTGNKTFSKDGLRTIYCTLPFDRCVYRWNETSQNLEAFLQLDFSGKNLPEESHPERINMLRSPYVIPGHFFHSDEAFIHSYVYKGERYYTFISEDFSKQKTGVVMDCDGKIPFFPRWQSGNWLIGSYSYDETDGEEKYGNVLVLFSLDGHAF